MKISLWSALTCFYGVHEHGGRCRGGFVETWDFPQRKPASLAGQWDGL